MIGKKDNATLSDDDIKMFYSVILEIPKNDRTQISNSARSE